MNHPWHGFTFGLFSHYEKIWLIECPSQFNSVSYRRVVADTIVLFKSIEYLKLFENYMHLKHKNIKFTLNSFSFVDVKTTRKNKRLVTSIFRKSIFSGDFNNHDSFIFDAYNVGLVYTLLLQYFEICSTMEKFHNYPVNITDQCIKKFLSKLCVTKRT